MTGSGELAPLVFDAEIVDEPRVDPEPVDLDAIVDAEVVDAGQWVVWRSPLQPTSFEADWPTLLRGGVVTDPREVEAIAARVDYARLPWWQRWFTDRPQGWRS